MRRLLAKRSFGDKLNEATLLEFGKRTAGVSRVGPSGPGARRLPPQMFHEYPNYVTLNGGGFVKQVGRNSFNGVSQRQKLPLPRGVFRTLHACQLVHRGVTDLTLDRFAVVQHRKSECQPLGVVSYNLASGQRHRSTPSLKGLSSHGIADAKGPLIPAKAGKTLTIGHAGRLALERHPRQEQGDPGFV
jgi:hypothetical protein